MEGSPGTRLPEADSLPDGFVESSAADHAPPPSDAGDPPSHSLALDQSAATGGGGDGGETLGAPSIPASVSEEREALDVYSTADALQSLTVDSAAEPERVLGQREPAGDTEDAKESTKESCVVGQGESLADQKGSGEQKRKVVKKSKVEKDRELFELAQAYHKVVAERDAVAERTASEFRKQTGMHAS